MAKYSNGFSHKKPCVVLCSPSLAAVSGVSTHANILLGSHLTEDFDLVHFQVGSEGRKENALQKVIRFVFSPFGLAFVLITSHAQIIHLNTSLNKKAYWRDLIYLITAKTLGLRIMTQVHGGDFPEEFFSDNRIPTWILKQALLASDVVIVLSSEALNSYRRFDSCINVRLVPNAILSDGLLDKRRVYNLDQPIRLLYLGRLVKAKGLFEAIEALGNLKRNGMLFSFDIAGQGPDQSTLEKAIEKAGLQGEVKFVGSVFNDMKFNLLLNSDIFIFPSYREGLPYAILESMAAGCVPITSPVGAITDVITNGQHGVFVPPRDAAALGAAICALDNNRAQLAKMGEAGRQRVREYYTVDRLAKDLGHLYRLISLKTMEQQDA
jgi:glycosyltransferase involved in cell wall biosynthesis